MNFSRNTPDQFLAAQISEGKEEAFDYIFRKYYRILCTQAKVFLKDDDLAQSVVQDCFIHFWDKRTELNDIRNLYSFLSFMVRNKAVDHLRKAETERKAVKKLQEKHVGDAAENAALYNEFEIKFMDSISKLPDRCRTAFEYSRFEGLKYSEIAERMNISQKAVEALIGRSLKILKADLSEFLPVMAFLFFFFEK